MKKLLCHLFNYAKLYQELQKYKQHAKDLQDEVDSLIKNSDGYIQPHLYWHEKQLKNPSPKWPSSLISDYFRLMDTERYPVYSPLVKYLERIGAVGSRTEIWTLPNGARVSIKPHIGSNYPFRMVLLTKPLEYRLREGWDTIGWWDKEYKAEHINQLAVAEVVRVLEGYLRTQRGVR
ncbi:hypothetical protein UFOVP785_79 [uncultured Caudovirales phage]|uniref:Uncharacterized protein n=1 Tax=uncultured Caudovirales phage TaxID=2100421 RepID=A0A6J5NZQ7_9CAUD|nr:hypothetical protein UFOVP785_79 [uncultured Caudovirales phage]